MKRYAAEFFGTFALVFAGTGAIVANDASGALSHVGISLVFGLIVLAMIYAVGEISGAHLNPAVSLGFFLAGRFEKKEVLPYCMSQCAGAVAASFLLHLIFPANPTLGATVPTGPPLQSFVLEVVMTWLLMLVILNVSHGAKEKGITAGIAVGAVIALDALLGGSVSGASMNPARSFGPALMADRWQGFWIYLAAPACGATLAVLSCKCVREKSCCAPFAGRAA